MMNIRFSVIRPPTGAVYTRQQHARYRFHSGDSKWLLLRVFTGLLLSLLAACSTPIKRTYVDPEGAEAAQCMQVCQTDRFSCRTPVQRRDEDCQYRYRLAYSQYQRCIQVRGARGGCVKPQSCSIPNYSGCATAYDQCFLGCGGQILTGEESYRVD